MGSQWGQSQGQAGPGYPPPQGAPTWRRWQTQRGKDGEQAQLARHPGQTCAGGLPRQTKAKDSSRRGHLLPRTECPRTRDVIQHGEESRSERQSKSECRDETGYHRPGPSLWPGAQGCCGTEGPRLPAPLVASRGKHVPAYTCTPGHVYTGKRTEARMCLGVLRPVAHMYTCTHRLCLGQVRLWGCGH